MSPNQGAQIRIEHAPVERDRSTRASPCVIGGRMSLGMSFRNAARNATLVAVCLAALCASVGAPAALAQPASGALFNRESYFYSSSLSTSQEANRYQVI